MQQRPIARFTPTLRGVAELWRAGWADRPVLRPGPKTQGTGRFDDPLHLVPVLYCGDDISTCVYEVIDALGLTPHHEAPEVLSNIPLPTEADEAEDAERDRQIALRPRRVPPTFFHRCAIEIQTVEEPAQLYDLSVVANRTALDAIPAISVLRIRHEYRELDLSAVTSPHRDLTQTIANELMRGEFADGLDGIANPSRRQGTIYAIFYDGRSNLTLQEVYRSDRFEPSDPMICDIAQQLGLVCVSR